MRNFTYTKYEGGTNEIGTKLYNHIWFVIMIYWVWVSMKELTKVLKHTTFGRIGRNNLRFGTSLDQSSLIQR